MKKIILTFFSVCFTFFLFAQSDVYTVVDEKPEYPGGETAMFKFLANNIKYAEEARKKRIQGVVFIGLTIDTDGSVINVDVKRSIHKLLDEESVRVVKKMPKWIPGKIKGQAVKTAYTIPISYKMS